MHGLLLSKVVYASNLLIHLAVEPHVPGAHTEDVPTGRFGRLPL